MMTLLEASDKVTPIIRSGLLGRIPELDEKFEKVSKFLTGYKLKGPFQLNQFEILDEEIEKAINELLEYYRNLE